MGIAALLIPPALEAAAAYVAITVQMYVVYHMDAGSVCPARRRDSEQIL